MTNYQQLFSCHDDNTSGVILIFQLTSMDSRNVAMMSMMTVSTTSQLTALWQFRKHYIDQYKLDHLLCSTNRMELWQNSDYKILAIINIAANGFGWVAYWQMEYFICQIQSSFCLNLALYSTHTIMKIHKACSVRELQLIDSYDQVTLMSMHTHMQDYTHTACRDGSLYETMIFISRSN